MNRGQKRAAWVSQHRARGSASSPRIELFVEQLNVVGLGALAPETLGSVVRAELAQMLLAPTSPVWSLHASVVPRVDGGSFKMPGVGCLEAIGQSVARAIAEGLRP